MGTGAWNPRDDLPLSRAVAVGAIAATGTSENLLVLLGVNLGDISLAGGWMLLDAGALGANTPPTFAQIASNTANTVTPSAAFSAVPAGGYRAWLFDEAAISLVAENLTEIGGTAIPSPGSPYSGPVLPVGGNDGTNERALSVDGFGRLTPQPPALVWDASGLAVAAATNVFATGYTSPNAGTVTLTIGNDPTGVSSVASLVKTSNAAPSGGSAGTRVFALNGGTALAAGDIYTFTFAATPNNTYNLQFATATTVDITAEFDQR